ncbi:MAG: hypothetical protein E2P01_09735 [Acidobacteria bacterium]|nr:MAG: hypothetical protein E2P01_09735 [Acidobacteriota bacterium]
MNALFESVAWNSLAALALAILVLVAGRIWKRPELLHVLWLVVLVKLVTPGVIRFDALPDVRKTVPVAFAMQSTDALPLAELLAASPAGLEARHLVRWSEASLAVWIGGSVLFLILVGLQCVRFARAMRAASPVGREIGQRITELARRVGVAAPKALLIEATVSPMVWSGPRRSTLILPSDLLDRLTADETDTLITHELAHLKRRDPWIRWVELAVTAALWWNPLVWWVRRRLRSAEEQACDRRVLELFPRAQRAYADGIVKTVEFLAGHGRTPQFATGATGTRHIKERLTMILNPSPKRRLRHPLVPALLLALLALPIVPGFAARDNREDDRTRAELLDLDREALDLQQRLQDIQAERSKIKMRLEETRVRAEAVEVRREVEKLQRHGKHEEAARLESELEQMEQDSALHRAHRAEMLERENEMRGAEFEMREAKIAFERARRAEDLSAAEDYERALAQYKQSHADRSVAYEEVNRMYARARVEQRQVEIAKRLDGMAGEHKRLQDANRNAEADKLAIAMERLHAEWVEADREELERSIEIMRRKLHELELQERQNGASP